MDIARQLEATRPVRGSLRYHRAALLAFALGMLVIPCRRAAAVSPDVVSFTISSSSLTFPSASPSVSSIAATENPITVTMRMTNTSYGTLTVIAGGDLRSGADTILINKVTWTTTTTAFVNGTVSKTSQVTVAAGSPGSNDVTYSGNLNFFFANSWTYATGSYIQTLTFTATAL